MREGRYQVQLGDARLAVPSGELISARSLRGASDADARPKSDISLTLPQVEWRHVLVWSLV